MKLQRYSRLLQIFFTLMITNTDIKIRDDVASTHNSIQLHLIQESTNFLSSLYNNIQPLIESQ